MGEEREDKFSYQVLCDAPERALHRGVLLAEEEAQDETRSNQAPT